jgi:hypothetical protein
MRLFLRNDRRSIMGTNGPLKVLLFVRLQQYWMIQKHTGKECWDWQVEFTVCRNIATF